MFPTTSNTLLNSFPSSFPVNNVFNPKFLENSRLSADLPIMVTSAPFLCATNAIIIPIVPVPLMATLSFSQMLPILVEWIATAPGSHNAAIL